jgi:hypothetical protein
MKTAVKVFPVAALMVAGVVAFGLVGAVHFGGSLNDTGNRKGNRITLYASCTGRVPVVVDAKVMSSVRGVIYQSGGDSVVDPPYLKTFMVEPGETLTGVVNAGVVYPGRAVVVTCAVTADSGEIDGGHDMHTKDSATPPPDVHCRGAVSAG